jgi:CoA:oxalate CoA-transferase
MSVQPLQGVRVLCVNNYLAGNYGPLLLALHGADVVKVETGAGEAMRASKPFLPVGDGEQWSHFELRMMRGMSSVVLDVNDAADRADFEQLVGAADVFWTNLRPDSAQRRRVDWPTLRAINPRLVYASVTGFGLPDNGEGEFGDLPAFDILVQGLTGLLARNAAPDGTPTYSGVPIADTVTSLYGAMGVLIGLRKRDLTGEGCVVDIAMFDSMVAINEKAMTMLRLDGTPPPPRASATTAPFGMFPTKDGWAVVAVGSDAVWKRFARAVGPHIGRPDLAEDRTWWVGTTRVARMAEIDVLVEQFTRTRTTQEVVDHLLAHDVPAGHSLEVDTIAGTRQVRERGIVQSIRTAGGASYPAVMSPVQVSGSPQQVLAPPRLGADRERVLADWLRTTTAHDNVDDQAGGCP